MNDIPDPSLSELKAELARRSHLEFMTQLWQRQDPLVVGRHTTAICKRIDQAIRDYKNGVSTFLQIKCVFRHGKSDIVSRYLPPRWIGLFPDTEIIVASHTANLSRDFSKFSRKVMWMPRYAEIYPKVRLAEEEQSADQWGIEKRLGKAYWVGLEGTITGRGGNLIVVDDFCKSREDAESETLRESTWNAFVDVTTRRAPVCVFILLATPWHKDDIFGRIDKRMNDDPNFPRFEELRFPAWSDEYKDKSPEGVLFPERYPPSWYDSNRATLGTYGTAALMQCDPIIRHGGTFETAGIKLYDTPPQGLVWKRGWDLASSAKQRLKDNPDFTSSIKLGVMWQPSALAPEPVIFIDDFTIDRAEAVDRDEKIKRIAVEDGFEVEVGIESYGPYKDALVTLQNVLHGIRTVTKVQLPGDKVTRAEAMETPFRAGNVWMRRAPWNDTLKAYLADFPGGSHDDPVDAMVTAFALHKPYTKHVWPSMAGVKVTGFDVRWGRQDDRTAMHYGSICLRKDLSVFILCTLWDDVAGKLMVYDSTMIESLDIRKISLWLISHMKLREFAIDKILANDRVMEMVEGTEKNAQRLINGDLRKLGVRARLTGAVKYDQWGSIAQVAQLVSGGSLYINDTCIEPLTQFIGWTIENGRPGQENTGWCEGLCLIVSDLKRRSAFRPRPLARDYMDQKKLQDLLAADPMRR